MNTHPLRTTQVSLVMLFALLIVLSLPHTASAQEATTDASTGATVTTPPKERPGNPVGPNLIDRLKTLRATNTGGTPIKDAAVNLRDRIQGSTTPEKPCLPAQAASSTGDTGRKPCAIKNYGIDMKVSTATRAKFIEQASTTRIRIQNQIMKIKEHREAAIEKRQEKLAEIKEKATTRSFKYIESIVKRISDTSDKLTELLEKTAAKAAEAAAAGTDVTTVDAKITVAQTALAEVQVSLDAAQATIAVAVAAEKPGEHMPLIRTAIKNVTEKVKTAHQAIIDAVKALREATATTSSTI
jgi:hypothetical protein